MRALTTLVLVVIAVLAVAGAADLGTQAVADLRLGTKASASPTVPPRPSGTAGLATAAVPRSTPSPGATATPSPASPSPPVAAPRRLPPGTPPRGDHRAVINQGRPQEEGNPLPPPTPAQTTTSAPARARPIVYVGIGASDAAGVGADNPATQNWVADLGRLLPPGSTVIDLGVPGILTGQADSQELPQAVAAHPDLVTVWLAVNDINTRLPGKGPPVALATYTHDLAVMLKTLHLRTHALVFVGNVPDLSLLPAYRGVPAAQLDGLVAQWNAAIATVAARYGAVLVDLYTPSVKTLPAHPEYISADGFHPSTLGYLNEAKTFWAVIIRHSGRLHLSS